MSPTDKPRRVRHPRDLVCPCCGANVDSPCSFSGRVQTEIHCTERLLALGDPSLRVEAAPGPPTPDEKPTDKRQGNSAANPSKKRRPLPGGPSKPGDADDDTPLTLFA